MDMQIADRQPHSIEVEQALLGAILVNNDAYPRVAPFLKREHFFDQLHAEIFDLCGRTIAAGHVADPKTLKAYLGTKEVGEISVPEYVAALAYEATSIVNAEDYGKTIHNLAIRRSMIEAMMDGETAARDAPPDMPLGKLLEEIEGRFAEIRGSAGVAGFELDLSTAVASAVDMVGKAFRGERIAGWPWFMPELAGVMDGPLEPGNLYGLLGASGDGKTSLALQQIRFSAEQGVPCLFLSGEQTRQQNVWQMNSQTLGIEAARIKEAQLSEEDGDRYFLDSQALAKLPIAIQPWSGLKVTEMAVRIRAFVKRWGPGIVVIDHAKKIIPTNAKDILAQQVFQVGSDLKDVMKDTGCAGILLMQRNSEFMKRRVMRPVRADVFGGESGLQNLDGCLALYRPARWMRERAAIADRQAERDALLEKADRIGDGADFYALKSRFGDESRVQRVRFQGRFTRFESIRGEREASLFERE